LHKEIEIMKGVHGILPVVIVDELCCSVHNSSYVWRICMLSDVLKVSESNNIEHCHSA